MVTVGDDHGAELVLSAVRCTNLVTGCGLSTRLTPLRNRMWGLRRNASA